MMSVDHEFVATIDGVTGRRSSKGINLDEIKFIDDEDGLESVRTVKNVGQNVNHSSNKSYTPNHATIMENVTTSNATRPLSSERLEAKRREIRRMRMKVVANSEKLEKAIAANWTETRIKTQDFDNQTKQVHQATPRKVPSSLAEDDRLQSNEDSANKTSREPFERGGFMRDKVREKRRKKATTNRSYALDGTVLSDAADEEEAYNSSGSQSSDSSYSDSDQGDRDLTKIAKSEVISSGAKSDTADGINHASLGNPPSGNFIDRELTGIQFNHQQENLLSSRLEKQSSIKHLHHRFVGRKQKSLRQKVLRKLGQQAILSNSSPDINAAVEEEDSESESSHNANEVKLKRHQAFRTNRRPSSPAVLTRCRSVDNVRYDSSSSEDDTQSGGRMRTFQLSEETFLETYGVIPRRKKKGTFRYIVTISLGKQPYNVHPFRCRKRLAAL